MPGSSTYPTSPPWAVPSPAPAQPEPQAGATLPHGGLMVPYPELMHAAGRPSAPSVLPVVLFTLFFGPLGAISALRRAGKAIRRDNPRYPYWLGFGVTLVAHAIVASVALSIAIPVYLQYRESAAIAQLESAMVHGDKIKTSTGVTVRGAVCTPTATRTSGDTRAYTCVVTLSNGQTGKLKVVAKRDGTWSQVRT